MDRRYSGGDYCSRVDNFVCVVADYIPEGVQILEFSDCSIRVVERLLTLPIRVQ